MINEYKIFQDAFEEFYGNSFSDETEEEITNELRKDFCYTCNSDEGYWIAMALRCKGCNKILIGG